MFKALYRYNIPLTKPIILASGQRQLTLTCRQGLLLSWQHTERFSECAPLPLFSHETLAECEQALLAYFHGGDAPDAKLASACFALDVGRFAIPQINEPVPLAGFAQGQSKVIKVKCSGKRFEQDLAHIAQLAGQGKRLRIDCNQRWTLAQLHSCYAKFKDAIEYFEEPLTETYWAEYHQLAVPFALDEQLRQTHLPSYANRAHTWVIKPMLTGLRSTLRLGEQAKKQGINLVLSSAHESNVSIEFYHNLASYLALPSPQGLDTLSLLTQAIQPSWLTHLPNAPLEKLC